MEPGEGHRHARLQQLIAEELAALLRDEVVDPRLEDVRVASVALSVDYRSARIGYVTQGNRQQVERGLERAAAFLRRRIGEALDLKRIPQLKFVYDADAAAAERAGKILDEENKT